MAKKYKGTPIHNSFAGAKQRCNYKWHKQYHDYGGRGIEFLWENFNEFLNDMEDSWFPGATIDRINNDGDYCKENCRWATVAEQLRNTSRNIHTVDQVKEIRRLYHSGEKTQVSLARIYNDSQGNISNIINRRTWDT